MRFYVGAKFKPEHYMDFRRGRVVEVADHAAAWAIAREIAADLEEEHERETVADVEALSPLAFAQ